MDITNASNSASEHRLSETRDPAYTSFHDDARHGLAWSIKQSFVDYVRRMPDGQGTMTGGAVPNDIGQVVYEPDPVEGRGLDEADLAIAFRGDVRFSGHQGMLFVRIADPSITAQGGKARMTIADPFGSDDGPRVEFVTFDLARLPSTQASDVWLGSDVRLTSAATAAFNDVYAAGARFDDLFIVLPRAEA